MAYAALETRGENLSRLGGERVQNTQWQDPIWRSFAVRRAP